MVITVLVTIPEANAEQLAKSLLEERICACVNIVKGLKSLFWGEGKIDEASEALLIIKTKETLFGRLKEMIKNNHPYNVPEIIGLKAEHINKEYLDWVQKEANAAPYTR